MRQTEVYHKNSRKGGYRCLHIIFFFFFKSRVAELYLGNARLKLIWLFAIWLYYFRTGTEHGLCLKNRNKLVRIQTRQHRV